MENEMIIVSDNDTILKPSSEELNPNNLFATVWRKDTDEKIRIIGNNAWMTFLMDELEFELCECGKVPEANLEHLENAFSEIKKAVNIATVDKNE